MYSMVETRRLQHPKRFLIMETRRFQSLRGEELFTLTITLFVLYYPIPSLLSVGIRRGDHGFTGMIYRGDRVCHKGPSFNPKVKTP